MRRNTVTSVGAVNIHKTERRRRASERTNERAINIRRVRTGILAHIYNTSTVRIQQPGAYVPGVTYG